MVSFIVYDLTFLVLFTLFIVWFLSKRKHQLGREGIIFMWRTQAGVKAINWFAKKFAKPLRSIQHLVTALGFVLMGAILWMLGQTLAIYIKFPQITDTIKAPPIAPLIPYFPKLFGLSSFFPDFYFTYFIVALAVVAVVHEFSHGIYMRLYKIKIKSTGLVFLGPILGAFVEQGEKSFSSKKKSQQMTVLAAGVFANTLFALIFYGLLVLFFFTSFTASGYIYSNYGYTAISINEVSDYEEFGNLTKVIVGEKNYYLDETLKKQLETEGISQLIVYSEAPAVLAEMKGAIIQGDDIKISNQEGLIKFLESKSPGDKVTFLTESNEGITKYEIILAEHPEIKGKAYLGVGHAESNPRGLVQKFLSLFMSFKERSTYYKPSWNKETVIFIYDFLWWIMIINLLVAIFNMLPLGMLDGGRFFYLAIWGITRNEKLASKAYKVMLWAILALFFLLMFYWFIALF